MRWTLWIAIAACACSSSKTADPPAAASPPAAAAAPAAAAGKREDRHQPASAPPRLSLAITIGGVASTWDAESFARAPKLAGTASDGEARDTWSLRELARRNVGPGARVVSVTGPDGKHPIDAAAWNDAARTPILHTTRRGTLKLRWADQAGRWGDTVVRDVTGLEISR